MGGANKELPKISDEFKPASQPPRPAPQSETRQPQAAPRTHQPVTRPAPMAPRTPPRAVQPQQQAAPTRQVAPAPQPIPQGASGLGDRLRAERQAAEKLAEQRVAQARGSTARGPEPRPLQPPPARQQPAPERPKFSFSPEELAKDKREHTPAQPEREFPSFSGASKPGPAAAPPPPLTPPRPALGGNAGQVQPQAPRPQPPRPAANTAPVAPTTFQPRFGNQPPPQQQPAGGNYRSLDPPGGFAPKSKPYADTSAFREDPLARRQPPVNREYDSYRRGPALPPAPTPAYGEDHDGPSLGSYQRNNTRPPVPARGRKPAYDEDVNEVFEDEEPPRPQRRRASAQDYNRAYRDYEEGYEAEAPRRRGPWPWLLAILLGGILIAGGMVYYYLNYYKKSGPTAGNVPVIEAPEQSSKTAPEPTSGSTTGNQGATQPNSAEQRKKIYDRILGDDEVGGNNKVVPTQEQPQVVEPTGDNGNQGDNDTQGAAPQNGAGDNNSSEPLPLPLPPPGSDQQGALPKGTNQQTAALGAGDKSNTPQPIPEPASTSTTDTGAPVPGQLTKSTQQSAAQPPPQVEEVSEPEPLPTQPEKPAKPKLKAEKKPAKKVVAANEPGAGQEGGVEPLVLVPPAQGGNGQAQDNQTQNTQTQIAEPDLDQPKAQAPAAEQKSKSFFNFGNTGKRKLTGKAAERASAQGATGNWANSPDPNASPSDADTADAAQPQKNVAYVEPEPEPLPTTQAIEPAPQPQQAKPSSGGFIAQLASFRSEAEAQAEYDRLSAKHGNVLSGLSPRIVKANVAGGSRYRLAVGPLASRAAASKICNSLIAAGERDCLVRGN